MKIKRVLKVYEGRSEEFWKDMPMTEDGKTIVQLIEYHEPKGDGDKHYCDVYFSSGKITRIFNPDEVDFK